MSDISDDIHIITSDYNRKITIAIDGFSSSGKSTLAKALARNLGYLYVDSGAMYRATSYHLLVNQVDINDETAVSEALKNIELRYMAGTETDQLFINEKDVTAYIRTMKVSSIVSEVAAISSVRKKLVEMQQNLGKAGGIVMDGRDIGTVVFPDAELKIYLTSPIEERAKRRFLELKARGATVDLEEVRKNLSHRDHIDSTRLDSPLKQAEDALSFDNSHLNEEETLEAALEIVKARMAELEADKINKPL